MGSKEKYIQKRKEIIEIIEDNSLDSDAKIKKLKILELLENFDVYETELNAQNRELLEKETQIVKSKEKYEQLFNLAPVAYFHVDQKYQILQGNQAAAELLSLSQNSLKTNSYFNHYIYSEDIMIYFNLMEEAKKYGKSEGKIRIKNQGEILYGHIDIACVQNADEYRYFISVLDISEDTKKDAILLRQAKFASMGEMLSMIAHQWKQPLAVISISNSNLEYQAEINETINLKELQNTTKIINSQIEYMNETLDDFKDFFDESRLKKKHNIKTGIARALKFTQPSLKNNNIKVSVNYLDEGSFMIESYNHDVCQIIINILNNAKDQFKQSNSEENKIEIDVYHQGKNIIFAIKNNAGTIPSNIVDFIFEQNFTTKNEKLGNGLGLYISQKIVKEHLGGKLWAENKPEEDSVVFYLEVPLKQEK